jgi:hypothetical protein
VLVGPPKNFDPQNIVVLNRLTARLGGRFAIMSFNSTRPEGVCTQNGSACLAWPHLAQTLRIFSAALPGIADEDEIVTSDDDRLPLVSRPFHVAPRPGASILRIGSITPGTRLEGNCSASNAKCTKGYLFDMCYVRGTRVAWKEAFYGSGPLDWRRMLEGMREYHFRIAKDARDRWFGDQALLTRHLIAWNGGLPSGGKLDTLYVPNGDVAPSPGWWSATHIYDPAQNRVHPEALRMIRSRQALELHKLRFVPDEEPFSARNRAGALEVLRAALDSLREDVAPSHEVRAWPPMPLADFFTEFVAASPSNGKHHTVTGLKPLRRPSHASSHHPLPTPGISRERTRAPHNT